MASVKVDAQFCGGGAGKRESEFGTVDYDLVPATSASVNVTQLRRTPPH